MGLRGDNLITVTIDETRYFYQYIIKLEMFRV